MPTADTILRQLGLGRPPRSNHNWADRRDCGTALIGEPRGGQSLTRSRSGSLHLCIDDATRLGYSDTLLSKCPHCAVGFLGRASDRRAQPGVAVEHVMTDNGSDSRRRPFRAALAATGLKHKRTRRINAAHLRRSRPVSPNRPARVGFVPNPAAAHRGAEQSSTMSMSCGPSPSWTVPAGMRALGPDQRDRCLVPTGLPQ
jgi:hypothetical protein